MKSILGFFKNIWKLFTGDKAKTAFARVDAMVTHALPIVREIAQLTPTPADDAIVALFERYHLPVEGWLALPPEQRGAALLNVATKLMQRSFPDVPVSQIHAAIELALVGYKAAK